MEVTPGIRRIGSGLVNVYLIEEAGAVTLVDAGVPGCWHALPAELAAMGRSLADVRAVVLTHAHIDHIGFAERIRTERGVAIRVHELDALRANGPRVRKALASSSSRGCSAFSGSVCATACCASRRSSRSRPSAMARRPMSPARRASSMSPVTPREAPPCTSRKRDAICVGDALITRNTITGATGPQLFPNFSSDSEQAYLLLGRLDRVDARFVLAGHGPVWDGGLAEALRVARERWTSRR